MFLGVQNESFAAVINVYSLSSSVLLTSYTLYFLPKLDYFGRFQDILNDDRCT
jgi:hypothetical protein